jgi:CRP-like cAMP-binding protein
MSAVHFGVRHYMTKTPQIAEIKEHIRLSPWFDNLPQKALDELAAAARWKSFAKDSYLFTALERTSTVFCLLHGCIRICITSVSGQEFAMTDLHEGAWIGDTWLIDDEIRVLEGRVVEEALVLIIPLACVRSIGDRYPEMYKNLFSSHVVMSQGIYEILGGMLLPLRARLAGRLLQLCRDRGLETAGGTRLNVKLSQKDFASLCLGSRQRVNKILREWSDNDIISFEAGSYVVKNLAALREENRSLNTC